MSLFNLYIAVFAHWNLHREKNYLCLNFVTSNLFDDLFPFCGAKGVTFFDNIVFLLKQSKVIFKEC